MNEVKYGESDCWECGQTKPDAQHWRGEYVYLGGRGMVYRLTCPSCRDYGTTLEAALKEATGKSDLVSIFSYKGKVAGLRPSLQDAIDRVPDKALAVAIADARFDAAEERSHDGEVK